MRAPSTLTHTVRRSAPFAAASLLALVLPLAAAGDDAPEAGPHAAARAAIERMAAGLEGVRILRGDYVQTQESLLLAEPIVSKGRLHIRREPGCLLLEIAEPRRVRIRSDATTHQIHHPDLGRAERWVFESNEATKALLQCFSSDARRLEQTFAIRASKSTEEAIEIAMEPRNEDVGRLLTELRLTIRTADARLVLVAHSNPEGEEVRIDVLTLELDPELDDPAALFDAPLPDGCRLMVHRVEKAKR